MKFLHTADLHLGRALENRSRAGEQRDMLAELIALADEEQVDLALLSGDIFDAFIPPAWAEGLFYDFLLRLANGGQRPVVVIAGNHDQPERLAAAAPLAVCQGIHILSKPTLLSLDLANGEGVDIAALPYLSEARLGEVFGSSLGDEQALDYQSRLAACCEELSLGFDPARYHLLAAHLFLAGGAASDSERPLATALQVGGSFGVSPSVFPADLDYIALGHLHRPQQIRLATPCYYAGSPLAYSFSEKDQQKSVIIGELRRDAAGEKHCAVRRLPLRSGLPLTEPPPLSYQAALDWCLDSRNHGCWVNLSIRLEQPLTAAEIDALRAAHPYLSAITPIYPQLEAGLAQARAEENLSVSQRFQRFASGAEGVACDEALLKAFLELLEEEEEENP